MPASYCTSEARVVLEQKLVTATTDSHPHNGHHQTMQLLYCNTALYAVCKSCFLPFQGPILNETRILPTSSAGDMVTFSWELSTSSIIPVSEFVVGSRVDGAVLTFPNRFPGNMLRSAFLQEEGVRYIFRIRASSANGGISPAIEVSWVTGDSLGEFHRPLSRLWSIAQGGIF